MRYPIDEESGKPYKVKEGKKVVFTKEMKPAPALEKVNEDKLKKANEEIIERAVATNPLPIKKEEPVKKEEIKNKK